MSKNSSFSLIKDPKAPFRQHIDRLRAAINPEDQGSYADWVAKHTRLRGKPYSYKGHEYQEAILRDPARVKGVRKPSQVGISELSIRRILAFLLRNPGTTAIYALPTASFAQTFAKTRFDIVIDESPDVKSQMYPGADSSVVKRFLNNSLCFFKGASRSGQVISVPADGYVIDEYDFMEDITIATQLNSRLEHSTFKEKFFLSTPTAPGIGISAEYEAAKQFVELTKCHRCGHTFLPDYYKDIIVPGAPTAFDLREVNYQNRSVIDSLNLDNAHLSCPKCRRPVSTAAKYRQFVWENTDSQAEAHFYQVTPFSCPETRTLKDVITAATTYHRVADFVNFGLGLPYTSSEVQITSEDIDKAFEDASVSQFPDRAPVSVMGLDMGGECACITAGVFQTELGKHIRVYSVDMLPMHNLLLLRQKIAQERNVISSVIDIFPYTDLVRNIQAMDPNAWGCSFSASKNSTELFVVKEKEEDVTRATFGVRQIATKRNDGLDLVVSMIRNGQISFAPSAFPQRGLITKHLTDMKRVRSTTRMGDETFVWKKSKDGEDHLFFALLYTVLASYLQGVAHGAVALPNLVMKIPLEKGV